MTTFDTHAILSCSTGILMGDIGGVYQVMSFLLDRDAYTHELAYYGEMASDVLRSQCPDLPGEKDFGHVNRENVREVLTEWEATLGKKFELNDALRGCLADEKNAFSTLKEMKPDADVIVIDGSQST